MLLCATLLHSLCAAAALTEPVGLTRRAALSGAGVAAASALAPLAVTTVAPPVDAAGVAAAAAAAPAIALPGGGNFFWWQAGAVAWLASHFDLSRAQFVGGSAGAMSATMAASGVDFQAAFELEERLLDGTAEAQLHNEPPYWGGYVRRWLDKCLPADACERCNGRLHVQVTELAPTFGTTTVSTYRDRDDLLDAVLASVHVPFWMDKRFCTTFRGTSCIDGSVYLPRFSEPALLSRPPYTLPDGATADVRIFQFDDTRMQEAYDGLSDFLAVKSTDEKAQMMEWGASYMKQLDARGGLAALNALRIVPAAAAMGASSA